MRKLGIFLAVVGVLLLALAAVLRFAVVPAQRQLPADADKMRHYGGVADTLLNPQALTSGDLNTLMAHNVPVTIDRRVKVISTEGRKAIVTETRTVKGPGGRPLGETSYTYAVDRKSLEPTAPFGGHTVTHVNNDALTVNWPFGTDKKDYTAYVIDTQGTAAATFSGEEKINGLNTYVFKTSVPSGRILDPQTLKNYPQALPKSVLRALPAVLGLPSSQLSRFAQLLQVMPDPVPITYFYTGQTTVWVAPDSGTVVKTTKTENRTAALTVPGQTTSTPLATVAKLTYTQTPESVGDAVEDAKDAKNAITLWGTTVPLIGLIVGVVSIGVGVFFLRPRRAPAPLAPK